MRLYGVIVISVLAFNVGFFSVVLLLYSGKLTRRRSLETLEAPTFIAPAQEVEQYRLFPAFYINLDRSIKRNTLLVSSLGSHLNLTRIRATDGSKLEELQSYVDTSNRTWDDYMNLTRVEDLELSLTISHFRAIQQAYVIGYKQVIVLEDDVSPDLLPFWDMSLNDLVAYAYKHEPSWLIIRLQHSALKGSYILAKWKRNQTMRLMPNCSRPFGSAAYLINRTGMKAVLDVFFINGKFDCLRKTTERRCISDGLLFSQFENRTFCVTPPMFTVVPTSKSTGLRCKNRGAHCLKGAETFHKRVYKVALKWARDFKLKSLTTLATRMAERVPS